VIVATTLSFLSSGSRVLVMRAETAWRKVFPESLCNGLAREHTGLALSLAGVLTCLTPTIAAAQNVGVYFDGDTLLEECEKESDACVSYVAGVEDLRSLFLAMDETFDYGICVPGEAKLGQLVDTVTEQLRDSPTERHYSGPYHVLLALRRSFPCSESKQPTGGYYFDVDAIRRVCNLREPSWYCLGYLAGVHDAAAELQRINDGYRASFCTAGDLGMLDMGVATLGAFANDQRPGNREGARAILVALNETFPCAGGAQAAQRPQAPASTPSGTPASALVRAVQSALERAGFDPGPVDGLLGKRTIAAIQRFQRSLGLAATGAASQELLVLLEAYVASRQEDGAREPTVARGSSGSGFLVDRTGHVVTNWHVIEQCGKVRILLRGEEFSAAVRATDERNDLALLKIAADGVTPAVFRLRRRAALGEQIVVAGFPLRGFLAAGLNVTTGSVSSLAGVGDNPRILQITAPVHAGNSGGPLLDGAGRVIGVVVAKVNAAKLYEATGDFPQNINFAIKGTLVKGFLDIHGVDYETREGAGDIGSEAVATLAKRFVVGIICER